MKMDIENYIKFALHVLISETQPKEKIIHHKIPGKPWEVVGADMFILHNKIT